MKVLILGSGGREHALAWKAAQSPRVEQIYVAPGNAGTALEPRVANVAIAADDIPALVDFARHERIDQTRPATTGVAPQKSVGKTGPALWTRRSSAALADRTVGLRTRNVRDSQDQARAAA